MLCDHRWANYIAGIDVKLDAGSNGYGDNFAVLGVRELVHSSGAAYRGRIWADGTWHKLQMKAEKNVITMYLDGTELGTYTDESGSAVLTGRATMMSGFWNTSFDNLEVLPIEGAAPYAVQKIDNTSPLLSFEGNIAMR